MQSEHLERAIKELATREHELVEAVLELPKKKHEYEIKYSIAFQMAEGGAELRKASATKVTTIEYEALLHANARVEVAKTKIADCRAVIEARRSLLSNEKSERDFLKLGLQA